MTLPSLDLKGLRSKDALHVFLSNEKESHPRRAEITPVAVTLQLWRLRYEITSVLGAGSFGIVRQAVDRITGRRYACKTVPKMPKRGKPTPRYLLKLQQEVDAMQQLGGSFDAVYLRVPPPTPPNTPPAASPSCPTSSATRITASRGFIPGCLLQGCLIQGRRERLAVLAVGWVSL